MGLKRRARVWKNSSQLNFNRGWRHREGEGKGEYSDEEVYQGRKHCRAQILFYCAFILKSTKRGGGDEGAGEGI